MFWRWPRPSWEAIMQESPREGQMPSVPTVAVREHAGQCGFVGHHLPPVPLQLQAEAGAGHSSHHHCCCGWAVPVSFTQLYQPQCAACAWALSLPGTLAQRGTWAQERDSHAEHGRRLPPRTTGTILKFWAGDSLDVSPTVGNERAGETSKVLLSLPRHRQAARCGHCCLLLQLAL